MSIRRCSQCREEKTLSEFYKDRNRKYGVGYICKSCTPTCRERHKKWRKANPEKFLAYKLQYHYNITLEDWKKQLEEQDGKCFICDEKENLAVDHCHDTGRFRGILCKKCNSGLGFFKDNEALLVKAVEYIRRN
jgi:hypothetical protein